MSSIHSYEVAADGSDFDEVWVNEMAVAAGRIPNVSINPMKLPDYIIWRSGAVYYAQNGRTGVVTSNAACHTLANGVLNHFKWLHFVGSSLDYDLVGAINFDDYNSAVISGSPYRATRFKPADTINAFEFDENWRCVLKDFMIDGSLQTTSGMGLKFTEATGTNYAARNTVKNIDFSGCYQGIGDLGATTNGGHRNLFEDLRFFDSVVRDVAISASNTGGWEFSRCHSDHIAVQASGNYLFQFSGIHGLNLNRCSWLTGGASSNNTMLIEDSSFLTLDRLDAEKAGQDIFRFDNCDIANISNIRAAEAGMDAGGTDYNVELNGCRDFNISNFFIGVSTGANSHILSISADGGTESNRIKFSNGNISSSAGYGSFIGDTSTYIKFNNVDFFTNTSDDAHELGTTNYNTYKNCSFQSGNVLTFVGANNVYDRFIKSASVFDLDGAGVNEDIFYAQGPCALAGFLLFYTEASSADVDWGPEAIRIGRIQDGVGIDSDYFAQTVTEASKNAGYHKHHNFTFLTNQYIANGDTVTVGTDGVKTGAGEIRVILQILENAS